MHLVFAIVGGFIGAIAGGLGDSVVLGAIAGMIVGLLLARLDRFEKRIARLEASAYTPRSGVERAAEPGPGRESVEGREPAPSPARDESGEAWPTAEPATRDSTPYGVGEVVGSVPGQQAEPEFEAPADRSWSEGQLHQPQQPNRLVALLKDWLTTGNVPVKVGVIVSFVGVSFLLKYAIDRELLVLPLEFRLLGVALAGMAMVAIGWRLRQRLRVYALSLQGGGLGIVFLTIFAAFRLWQLLPLTPAFVLLVVLAGGTAALAVLQDARALAILGIVGGFLAPVLTSTGQGSHVVLFSYYLLLNGAILGIAWFRAWRGLNVVGFVFTFVISAAWGYRYFRPHLFASTEPFLLLYFLFYQAIAILYALRQPPERLGAVDGTLVFGTPVIVFALQARLVHGMEYGLAVSAAAAAVFYACAATLLFRRKGAYLRLLTESFLALAVAFATLAIPLALDARWTSAAWALEGAALVWIGVRQARQLAILAGMLLIVFSGFAFALHGWRNDLGLPVLNGNVLGGLLISCSALFASRKLAGFEARSLQALYRYATYALFAWGALWWAGSGWLEILDRVPAPQQTAAMLLFMALSCAAAAWGGRLRSWPMLQGASAIFLLVFVLLALRAWDLEGHLLRGLGWLAWPAAIVIQGLLLRDMDERRSTLAGEWHFVTLLLFTAMLGFEGHWWIARIASEAWAAAVAVSAAGVAALAVWRLRARPAWPVPPHLQGYITASLLLVAFQALALAGLGLLQPGDPDPLPYVPVFNPFDLAMLFAIVTALLSLKVAKLAAEDGVVLDPGAYAGPYRALLALALFVMTTTALVRGVHFYGAVPWRLDELFASVRVQTALSIYWGLLGFAGMVLGARRRQRPLWLLGAGFMALVVIKLFLIDLGNSGTLERIISFIGIGALLLLVGYIAPVPPRGGPDDREQRKPEPVAHED